MRTRYFSRTDKDRMTFIAFSKFEQVLMPSVHRYCADGDYEYALKKHSGANKGLI